MPTCNKCGIRLNDNNWYPSVKAINQRKCKSCWVEHNKTYYQSNRSKLMKDAKVYSKNYYEQHKEQIIERSSIYRKQYYQNIKLEVIFHYSPMIRCVKCGYIDIRALSIDHINGGGAKHRKQIGNVSIYTWLKKNNYPDGFQVLCMNCQWIKREENNEWGNK